MQLSLHPQLQGTLRLGLILGEYTPPPASAATADGVAWVAASGDGVAVEVLAPETAPASQSLAEALAAAELEARESYERVQALHEVADVAQVRRMFHDCGIDPARDRPSSEALLRRVLKGEGVPRINILVDVNNLASLELLLPIGVHDAFRLVGDVVARFGRDGETLETIGPRILDVNGVLLLADELGAFGSPLGDGARTMVRPETTRLLGVLYIPHDMSPHLAEARTQHAAQRFADLAGVRVTDSRLVS